MTGKSKFGRTSALVDLVVQPCQEGLSLFWFALCCLVFLLYLFSVNNVNFIPRLGLLLLIRLSQISTGPGRGESSVVLAFQIAWLAGHMLALWYLWPEDGRYQGPEVYRVFSMELRVGSTFTTTHELCEEEEIDDRLGVEAECENAC